MKLVKPIFLGLGTLIGFIIFVLGFLIDSICRNVPYIIFDNSLGLGEILNLISIVFMTFYIPFLLNRKIDNKRVEKNLLINECCELITELRVQKKFFDSKIGNVFNKQSSQKLILGVRNIGNMTYRLIERVSKYEIKEIGNVAKSLKMINHDYWIALTNNLGTASPLGINQTYINIEKEYFLYMEKVHILKFYINEI
jgi:hypothetical protein